MLIVPYTYIYTGNFPWDIICGVPDQAQAFAEYYQRLSMERTPERILIMVARTMFSPLMVALIPLIFWTKRLRVGWKILFIMYILLYFSFSLLRGTDKESADFLVYFLCRLVCTYCHKVFRQVKLSQRRRKIWPIRYSLSLGYGFPTRHSWNESWRDWVAMNRSVSSRQTFVRI